MFLLHPPCDIRMPSTRGFHELEQKNVKVSEVMTRGVRTVSPDTPLSEVAAVMCLNHIAGMPVVDADGKVQGIIAEKDLLHYLFPTLEEMLESGSRVDFEQLELKYRDLSSLKVSDLMVNKLLSVEPDMPLLKATSVMVRHRFRRIPVMDGDTLVGMLSLGDVHKALFSENMLRQG